MNILIKSLSDAITYKPTEPTYAIRIFSPGPVGNERLDRFPLVDSPNYKHITVYRFDDIDYHQRNKIVFDESIASKIIEDFAQYKDQVETLLVHCIMGKNRSPSVAMALNEKFDLGANVKELRKKYPENNKLVYRTMMGL
jgi:predicted protein tyrosine phosphatase